MALAINNTSVKRSIPGIDFLEIPKSATTPQSFQEAKNAPALRYDEGKTNWSLMPFEAIEEISKVLDFGANKYAEWNFANDGGMKWSRVINSCLRHIFKWMRGEDLDPESGLHHLAHAGCNIVFLLYYVKNPHIFNKDDRHRRS